MTMQTGTFYGVGVGPGDPGLLTLKAIDTINRADVIFAASSVRNNHSLAVDIARPHIHASADIRMLSFQMSHKTDRKEQRWEENADTIIAELEAGKNAVFLTLGDTLTYSTYGYLVRIITEKAPHLPIRTIPGVPSYLAAAARLNQPLVEGDESLLITSGAHGGEEVRKFGPHIKNMVMLKVYRHIEDINAALEETDLLAHSRGISRCCREDEEIIEDVKTFEHRKPDYWSLIIAKRNTT